MSLEAWSCFAFQKRRNGLVFLAAAIGAALSFWADVGGIRSWLQGDQVTRQLIAEHEKTRAVAEALPAMVREEMIPILSEFIDGRAAKALEISIVTEDKFTQEQQEKLRAGRFDEVIKAVQRHRLERVSEYSGLLARAYLQKGDIEFHARRFDRAEQFYPVSLREARGSGEQKIIAECYFELGAAAGMQGMYQEARQYFWETIKIRPDLAEAYNNRANAYAEKGEHDLAITDYDRAIRLKPNYSLPYHSRGFVYKKRGKKQKAIGDFERFLELSEEEYWREETEKQLRELRGQ